MYQCFATFAPLHSTSSDAAAKLWIIGLVSKESHCSGCVLACFLFDTTSYKHAFAELTACWSFAREWLRPSRSLSVCVTVNDLWYANALVPWLTLPLTLCLFAFQSTLRWTLRPSLGNIRSTSTKTHMNNTAQCIVHRQTSAKPGCLHLVVLPINVTFSCIIFHLSSKWHTIKIK